MDLHMLWILVLSCMVYDGKCLVQNIQRPTRKTFLWKTPCRGYDIHCQHMSLYLTVNDEKIDELLLNRGKCQHFLDKTHLNAVSSTTTSRRAALISAGVLSSAVFAASQSFAVSDASSSPNAVMNELLDQLRTIPTFCIVSNSTGAAYMLYKRDMNMGIGYAFLTYTGALAVLKDAQENAIQKGYGDVWTNATITTIPLDVAVRLALKKRTRISSKEQSLETLLTLIPGAEDRLDGMAIDKSRFQDQGRVPLFYVENNDPNMSRPDETVFYFARKDLVSNWNKIQQQPPVIKAVDLMGIFESLLLGRNVEGKVSSLLLSSKFTFIPNIENVAIAKEMKARGLAPYNPNKMIL